MREFFMRIERYVFGFLKRFLRQQPNNPYEALAFRVIREATSIYSRRVIYA